MLQQSIITSSFWIENGHLTLDILKTSEWYTTLYQFAFFVALCIFIYEGFRRKYPLSSWLIITASISLLLIVGSKIGTYSLEDWQMFIQTGELESTGKKTALGAVLLIVPGLWLVRRYIHFNAPVWGAFAFFAPAMMLVQRMGCMMAGCCYGTPTNAKSGIRYFGPSVIRDQQIHGEHIPFHQYTTEAVHNVPLYYMLVAVLTIILLLFLRKHIKNGKRLLLVSMSTMLVGRFVIDFFRDVQAHNITQELVYGLKPHQWIMAAVFMIFVWLYVNAKNSEQDQHSIPVYAVRNLLMLLLLALVILGLSNWFTMYERTVLYAQMIVAIGMNLNVIWTEERRFKPLVAPLTIVLATTWLMAQHSEPTERAAPKGKTYFNGSLTQNRLNDTYYPCSIVEQGCIGDVCALSDTARPHGPNYNSLHLGVEHEFSPNAKGRYVTLGVDGVIERYGNRTEQFNAHYFHVSPYVTYRGPIGGISVGIRTGQMFSPAALRPFERQQNNIYYIVPRFGYWFGSDKHLIMFRVGIFDDYMPNGVMPSIVSTRATFRISDNDKRHIRAGIAYAGAIDGNTSIPYIGLFSKIHFKENNTTLMPGFGVTVPDENQQPMQLLPQFSLHVRTEIFR